MEDLIKRKEEIVVKRKELEKLKVLESEGPWGSLTPGQIYMAGQLNVMARITGLPSFPAVSLARLREIVDELKTKKDFLPNPGRDEAIGRYNAIHYAYRESLDALIKRVEGEINK